MESFLPSEIGRLIYGYLAESNEELADLFLNSSNVMEECRLSKKKSRKFSAKVQGLSLVDILDRYSILCSLIFKQVQSSECVHQNILKLLTNIMYTKVREHNEQLANEMLEPSFNFANSIRSETAARQCNEINDSANESVLRNLSTNEDRTASEIAPNLADNLITINQDVENMDVSSSSTVSELHNLSKTSEKTVQTEPISVIGLIENNTTLMDNNNVNKIIENSMENNKNNKTPEKPTQNSTIDLTVPSPQAVVLSPKFDKNTVACNRKNVDKSGKSGQNVICKAKLKMMQNKNQVSKSKLKTALSVSTIPSSGKASEIKQPDDLRTPPEAEKSSRLPANVLANLSLNPSYRHESYITPLKRFSESSPPINDPKSKTSEVTTDVTQSVQLAVDNVPIENINCENHASKSNPSTFKQAGKSDCLKTTKKIRSVHPNEDKPPPVCKRKSDSNESLFNKPTSTPPVDNLKSNLNKGTPEMTQLLQTAIDNIPAEVKSNKCKDTNDITRSADLVVDNVPADVSNPKNPANKSIPNILKKTCKLNTSKIKAVRNVHPNQDKPPPVSKLKSDLNEPAMKSTPKCTEKPTPPPTADSFRELQLLVPRAQVGSLEKRYPGENPHIQRPPPLIEPMTWDAKLRHFVGDIPENSNAKNTRKTPRKTPRKLKRESTSNIDEHPKKRSKLLESVAPTSKREPKTKTERKQMNTSSDLDKSAEDLSMRNSSRNINNIEPQSNQSFSAKQTDSQPSLKRESPDVRLAPEPESTAGKKDTTVSGDKDIVNHILQIAVENVTKSQSNEVDSQLDETEESSDYGMNLTLENEVVLYEANLTPL